MASEGAPLGALSEDTILGGRVRLIQPTAGYRVAVDPILLAASVSLDRAGDRPGRVVDLGCGTGAASLCLAHRDSRAVITGIEIDAETAEVARRNVALNGGADRIAIETLDVRDAANRLGRDIADHVITNPPYLQPGRHRPPLDLGLARSHLEGRVGLEGFVGCAHALLKTKGWLTVIYRADRVDDVMAALRGRFGAIAVLPIWPRAGAPAKRIIVRARKGSAGPAALLPGLVLHRPDGGYTNAAAAILMDAAALEMDDATWSQ